MPLRFFVRTFFRRHIQTPVGPPTSCCRAVFWNSQTSKTVHLDAHQDQRLYRSKTQHAACPTLPTILVDRKIRAPFDGHRLQMWDVATVSLCRFKAKQSAGIAHDTDKL